MRTKGPALPDGVNAVQTFQKLWLMVFTYYVCALTDDASYLQAV